MATIHGIFVPDYQGSQAAGLVGTVVQGAPTGPILLGKYRLFQLMFANITGGQVPSTNQFVLRFTLGNSAGTVAPSPGAGSPFFLNNLVNQFELSAVYDSINLANLVADNGTATSISYCILPLAKF